MQEKSDLLGSLKIYNGWEKVEVLQTFYRLSLPNIGGFNLLPDSDPRRELISFCKVLVKNIKGQNVHKLQKSSF